MKTLTIKEVETSSSTVVWALNATKQESKGSVIFTVPSSMGGGTLDSVYIPMTFLPINLTDQVTKHQLLQSSQFRKAVTTGMILLISEEEADALNVLDGADRERARLQNEMVNGVMDSHGSEDTMVNVDLLSFDDKKTKESKILPAIIALMADAGEKDEATIINSLRTLKSDMTDDDYNYVIDVTKEYGLKRVQKFCARELEK